MSRLIYARPVIPLLIPLMAGIIAGAWFPGIGAWCIALLGISLGWLFVLFRQKKHPIYAPLFLFAALGYLSIQSWIAPRFPANHVIHFAADHSWSITGIIQSPPLENRNRLQFALDAQTLMDPRTGISHGVVGHIRITVYRDSHEMLNLSMGDRITATGRIRILRNFHNPHGFNYERHMAFQKIWTSASTQSGRLKIHDSPGKIGLKAKIEQVRSHIADWINSRELLIGGQREKAVLRALVIGDRSGIAPELRDAFNRAGVGHLLAISGLHVGIVATVVFFAFQWIFSFLPALLWRGWIKKAAGLAAVFPVIAYGLIAGMSPSTQRAVIMVTVFLLTFAIEREHDLINTLALAAMVILVAHPPALFSVSFQLSFAAVFSIVYGLSRLPDKWTAPARTGYVSWIERKGKRGLVFIFVSIFATLGTLPLVMTYFNQVSSIGIFSNCIMVPLIGSLVVPLALLSVITSPLWAFGAGVILDISGVILFAALSIAEWLSDLSFSAIRTVTPNTLETICYYGILWAVIHFWSMPPGNRDIRSRSFARDLSEHSNKEKSAWYFPNSAQCFLKTRLSVPKIAAWLSVILLCTDGGYCLINRFWRDDLTITALDVGQGSSSLLELPGGRCMLVDGGGFSDNGVFDVGERIIAPLLWRKKIMTVDTLILTHPNSDHLNGLLYIADTFHVNAIWMNNDVADTLGYHKLIHLIETKNIHRPNFNDLPRVQTISGVTFHILHPPRGYEVQYSVGNRRNLDNHSLVLKVSYGLQSFLFTGDIMAKAEKKLVSRHGGKLKSGVLFAPHHGSKTSSTLSFLRKTAPQVVIIPAGWQNRFGFPHRSVVRRYQTLGIARYTTGENGAIMLTTDGNRLSIKPMIPVDATF